MILTVGKHPIAMMFPQFFRQLPGHADAVVGFPLDLLIVTLANVCARPIAGLPAIGPVLGKDMLIPDAMEFRLRIAIGQCGLLVIGYMPASFGVACDLHLSPIASMLAVDRNHFPTHEQPASPSKDDEIFPLFPEEARPGLLISCSGIQGYIGPTCLEGDNDRYSPDARLLAYIIDTFINAASKSDHSIQGMPDRILLLGVHRMLEESGWYSDIARPVSGPNTAIYNMPPARPQGLRPGLGGSVPKPTSALNVLRGVRRVHYLGERQQTPLCGHMGPLQVWKIRIMLWQGSDLRSGSAAVATTFCEQADPLIKGAKEGIMHGSALSTLISAELEDEITFKESYLADGSPIETLLAKKITQLRSTLDLQGFVGSILGTGELTRTSTVHAKHAHSIMSASADTRTCTVCFSSLYTHRCHGDA